MEEETSSQGKVVAGHREQDLGIQGLRQAKESYHPDHMVEKFTASLKVSSVTPLSLLNPHEFAKHSRGQD